MTVVFSARVSARATSRKPSAWERTSYKVTTASPGKMFCVACTKLMTEKGHNIASLRAEATREALPQIDTLDKLIDRQFKNIRLLMQAHDSAKFAPQLHKKLDLEIKQLELQVKKSDEDQRLEVARQ